jgi:hypothetical protein
MIAFNPKNFNIIAYKWTGYKYTYYSYHIYYGMNKYGGAGYYSWEIL